MKRFTILDSAGKYVNTIIWDEETVWSPLEGEVALPEEDPAAQAAVAEDTARRAAEQNALRAAAQEALRAELGQNQ